MISKVECVILECDNCKDIYRNHHDFTIFVDESNALEDASEDGWYLEREDGKHYCEDCHHIDDDDQFVLNKNRTKLDEII